MSREIRNAVIKSVSIDDGDRGLLTAWLELDYGFSGQGFGGFSLYLPKSYSHHTIESVAGHFIYRCMEIAGVNSWDKIKGKTIRADADFGGVYGIGHIVNDDWFYPAGDFEKVKEGAKKRDNL